MTKRSLFVLFSRPANFRFADSLATAYMALPEKARAMSAPILNLLIEEMNLIQAQWADERESDPRSARFRLLKALVENYRAEQAATVELRPNPVRPPPSLATPPGPRIGSMKQRAIDAAALFLAGRDNTLPTATGTIFEHLRRAGVRIGGKDPKNNLSAILSSSGRFKANGRSGWTLAPVEEDQSARGRAAGLPDDQGSFPV